MAWGRGGGRGTFNQGKKYMAAFPSVLCIRHALHIGLNSALNLGRVNLALSVAYLRLREIIHLSAPQSLEEDG